MIPISASVGRGGKNVPGDVVLIQRALNAFQPCLPNPLLKDDGQAGGLTLAAIERLQRHLGIAPPDGRIDPGGPTHRALSGDVGQADGRLTLAQIQAIMPDLPGARAQACYPHLLAAMDEFGISKNALRMAAFLAQIAHESGQLRYFKELWGPTKAQRGYEGRADLGNTHPGDGKRFRGRGAIQITGRGNYKDYGDLLGLPLVEHPELAETPEVALRVSGAFWLSHGLNELADAQLFKRITKRINGGYNGLEDRERYYRRAKQVLGVI